jgi:hypothetical protein
MIHGRRNFRPWSDPIATSRFTFGKIALSLSGSMPWAPMTPVTILKWE